MTASEMHILFKTLSDKVGSLEYPGFEPEEIDLLLSVSQRRVTKQRYGPLNAHQTGFEVTQKRTDDLRTLTTNEELLPVGSPNAKPNGTWFLLPSDYWFAVEEEIEYYDSDCEKYVRMEVTPRRHDEYNKIIKNPYHKPTKRKSIRLAIGSNFEVITHPDITPIKMYLRYIRKPQDISISLNQDCELAEEIHEEIVNEAVNLAVNAIGDNRARPLAPFTQGQE